MLLNKSTCGTIFLCTAIFFIMTFNPMALNENRDASTSQNRSVEFEIQECAGCHFESRTVSQGVIEFGLQKWTDSNCYGCHLEIDDIAKHVQKNKHHESNIGLPISNERLRNMKTHPLPYLNTPLDPFHADGIVRINQMTALRFLKQPTGQCSVDGCQAPKMMAYGDLDLKGWLTIQQALKLSLPPESDEEHRGHVQQGERIFQKHCRACHQNSTVSGYDAVGLSLFASDWLYQYATGKTEYRQPRAMPTLPITKSDSIDLYAYFQQQRNLRKYSQQSSGFEEKTKVSFHQVKDESLNNQRLNHYFTHKFWLDAGCVHCHAAKGRAKTQFNMENDVSILTYLKSPKHQFELYKRLKIRHLEAEYGLGYSKSGMPMTGSPLPDKLIFKLTQWMKSGCMDHQSQVQCPQQNK
jgi:mono/diheme cytochrome c family protein/cytochrome c553